MTYSPIITAKRTGMIIWYYIAQKAKRQCRQLVHIGRDGTTRTKINAISIKIDKCRIFPANLDKKCILNED